MSHLETVLTDTLQAWRRSRFAWLNANCLLSLGDYVRDLTGRDPAAPWRHAFGDEQEAMAIVAAAGGAKALMGPALIGVGLVVVDAPLRGDVVCVEFGGTQIGGLCLGETCAFRMERGVNQVRTALLSVVGAWRV